MKNIKPGAQAPKPGIIVLESTDPNGFAWMSDGWNSANRADTKESKALMKKAKKCIEAGQSKEEVCALLIEAGFSITYAA